MEDIDRMEDIEMTERDASFLLEQLCCWWKKQREQIPLANWPIVVMDLFCLTFAVFEYANKFYLWKTSRAMRDSGNNGAAALSALTQFKAVVMKGGFMLIIRHANVAHCYALEQGTRPGLIACEPRRHFLAFAYGKNVCLEKYI